MSDHVKEEELMVEIDREVDEDEEIMAANFEKVEKILGHCFRDRELVTEAITHSSYYYPSTGRTYQGLQFVGNNVLGCAVARHFFTMYPDASPGDLTTLRSANIDNEKLARVSLKCGLYEHLRHKCSVTQSKIDLFKEESLRFPAPSRGLVDEPKVLANMVESLIGAIFIDSDYNLDTVWDVFRRLTKSSLINLETIQKHPVSQLQEICQKNKISLVFVDTWKENSEIKVVVDGNIVGSAIYEGKKEIAQNRAAKVAVDNLLVTLQEQGRS